MQKLRAEPTDIARSNAPVQPSSRAFLFGYVVAQVGAFLSFLPLFQILLPIKAEQIAAGHRVQLLGVIAAIGALAGGAANLVAGHLSDRTRSRFGRRRPWLVVGLAATLLSYGLIWRAHSAAGLIAAVALFQVAFNVLFAPLVALTPDRVPTARRGMASGLLALGQPLALIIGGVVIGAVIVDEGLRYAVLALMVALAIGPFALTLHDPGPVPIAGLASTPDNSCSSPPASAPSARTFWLGWVSRAFTVAALCLAQTYLLFFLQDGLHYTALGLGRAEQGVSRLAIVFGVLSVAAALAAGRLSDRLRRRRPLVIFGAVAMAAGLGGVTFATSWPAMLGAYAVFGLGAGCHTAVDFAMMTELLPSRDHPARDLAVLNLSNIVPQVVAPVIGSLLIVLPGGDIRWIFGAAAVSAVLAAAVVGSMGRVR